MSGILNLAAGGADLSAENPVKALPRSLGERIEATSDVIFSPDRYFNANFARRDMWQRTIDELHTATGQALPNPYADRVTGAELSEFGNQYAARENRRNKIIEASRLARANGNEDLFDPENIDRYIAEDARRREQTAGAYEGTGNGVGNFLAGTLMGMAEPVNAATLFLPVSRLPSAAASAIGRSFVGNVAREAALQAGANVASQAVTEALDYSTKSEFGTQSDMREIGGNLVTAAGFGALLGGGVRALHLKWLGLPEKVRSEAPLAVQDAMRVVEADALYSGQNRIGLDPGIHERYQGRAYDAVMRGQPVQLEGLGLADTPMTALGTILREAPQEIRADGLANAIDRIRMLPGAELEPVVRELKPQAFAQLDAIDAKLKALDDRVAAIHGEAQQIGVTDIIDLDTAALINDAIEGLKKPGLTRRQRIDLEHQRDTWMQSIDPRGELTGELERTRKEFFPEHGPALKEIAAERDSLMRDRQQAQGEVQREVDFLKGKLEKMDFAKPEQALKDIGVTESADLPALLQRAEFERQVRLVRETAPGLAEPSAPRIEVPPAAEAKMTPEQAAALETAGRASIEAKPDTAVMLDGLEMPASKALEQLDRIEKEAAVAKSIAEACV